MSTEIYFFSGTGNSLHIARELHGRLPGAELMPIVGLLDRDTIATRGEAAGFVFPVYLTTIPAPVRRFLEKLDVRSVRYTFTVLTRIGTFCVANINVARILKRKGTRLDARFIINMANNSPTGLVPGKGDERWVDKIRKENVSRLECEARTRLDTIAHVILAREKHPKRDYPNPCTSLLERVMYLLTRNTRTHINFYADETCTGCGTCARVCPSGKACMHGSRPRWQREVQCFYCYACFNFCPTQSILVRNKYIRKDGRYFHPDITADDIAGQKQYDA